MTGTHLAVSPLDYMHWLAALAPRPRLHVIRFPGVLATNAELGALVLRQEPEAPAQRVAPAECEANSTLHRAMRQGGARLLKRALVRDTVSTS